VPFEAVLEVDAAGFVTSYPPLWGLDFGGAGAPPASAPR